MEANITIRKGTEAEWALAFDSFLEEYRRAPAAQRTTKGVLAGLFGSYLMQWRYLVACEPETPEEIMGFIVASSQGAVAWVQVKAQYRRKGVATALLSAAGVKAAVETPFMPDRTLVGAIRDKGFRLYHRPWMVP